MSLLWRSFPYSFSSRCPPQQCIHNSITPLHTSHSLLRDLSYPFPLPVSPGLEPYQIVFIFSAPGPWQAFPPGLYLSWKQSGSKQEWINSVFRVHWSVIAVWPGGVTTLTWNFRIFWHERSCLHFKITAQWELPEPWRLQAVTLPHHLGKQPGWGGDALLPGCTVPLPAIFPNTESPMTLTSQRRAWCHLPADISRRQCFVSGRTIDAFSDPCPSPSLWVVKVADYVLCRL